MAHSVRPLPFKPPRLDGLSERLLASHYENNYGGAVRRLNAIDGRLDELDWATAPVFELNGLKREELIAANSMILHEIYFDGLGGSAASPTGGSRERYRARLRLGGALAGGVYRLRKALAGGSGWVLLSGRSGSAASSSSGPPTTPTGSPAALRCSRSICTSTPIISTSAPRGLDLCRRLMRNIHWERIGARFAGRNGSTHGRSNGPAA